MSEHVKINSEEVLDSTRLSWSYCLRVSGGGGGGGGAGRESRF